MVRNETTSGAPTGDTLQPAGTPLSDAHTAHNSMLTIVIAVGVLAVATIGAAVVLVLFGKSDSTPVIVTVFSFVSSVILALLALVKSQQVGTQVESLHVDVNSRLSQLMTAQAESAHARGVAEGADQERARVAVLLSDKAAALALVEAHARADAPRPVVVAEW